MTHHLRSRRGRDSLDVLDDPVVVLDDPDDRPPRGAAEAELAALFMTAKEMVPKW